MRLLLLLAALLCPAIVMAADSSFSFAPPLSDISVVFLSDIFGVVDGVLHGTGSQIMGAMFAVFNAAVLALGGIVIMYTLIVGTMNTAHEGEMLGHKWSSVWIPVRATLGLALLLPKASGYCLIQIFVMWVVVQGVGAADKIWNAALGYLNSGGKIVQAQSSSVTSTSSANLGLLYTGAGNILSAQVCMLGLQKQAEAQRESLNKTSGNGGICNEKDPNYSAAFCNTSVPSFIDTVDFVKVQEQNPSATTFTVNMPNFQSTSTSSTTTQATYLSFDGKCGTMTWNAMQQVPSMSVSESATFNNTRALALQQMYDDLSQTAQSMISNDPQLNSSSGDPTTNNSTSHPPQANDAFGLPKMSNGSYCTNSSNTCTSWGEPTGSSLFAGSELVGSVYDYNGVMMPSLNLAAQAENASGAQKMREFIAGAEANGWMTAGQYFFDLVNLSGSATSSAADVDSDSGFPSTITNLSTTIDPSTVCATDSTTLYCLIFPKTSTVLTPVLTLIGTNPPNLANTAARNVTTGDAASTAYGFVNNAAMVQLPGQPGLVAPPLSINMNIAMTSSMLQLPRKNFDCGLNILGWCVGRSLGDLFYNDIILGIFNVVISGIASLVDVIIQALIYVPMMTMVQIFVTGVGYISHPGDNPIVALALMGTAYINYMVNMWISFGIYAVIFAVIPGMIFLWGLAIPLVMSWMAIMVGVGFTTAYYIPIYPYMIFTFGVIAWLMAVIEAMVAAPIVALGITHPEGEGMLGKGEQALMILMNVFLRPAMMIIGYITAIAMCYIGVWVLNVGFEHVSSYTTGIVNPVADSGSFYSVSPAPGYVSWASLYAGFFAIVIYTSMYLTIVQKSFTLIYALPDKVLRWIGGHPESVGQELAQWNEETKGKLEKGGEETGKAAAGMSGKTKAATEKKTDSIMSKLGSAKPKIGGS